jgi:hypothetical protein
LEAAAPEDPEEPEEPEEPDPEPEDELSSEPHPAAANAATSSALTTVRERGEDRATTSFCVER